MRDHLGDLEVMGSPMGAEVVIEGEIKGTLPLGKPIRVRSGESVFEVRARGYESTKRTVQISTTSLTRETVDLARVHPAATPRLELATSPPSSSSGGITTAPASPPLDGERGRSHVRAGSLVLVSAGLAATVTGFILYRMAGTKLDRIKADANASPPREYDEANGNWQTLDRLGVGGLICGGAALVGGVVLYVLNRDPSDERKSKTLGVGPAKGVAIGATF